MQRARFHLCGVLTRSTVARNGLDAALPHMSTLYASGVPSGNQSMGLRQLSVVVASFMNSSRAFATATADSVATHSSLDAARHSNLDQANHTAKTYGQGLVAPHPSLRSATNNYMLMNPVYSKEYVESVGPTHKAPDKLHEKVAYYVVQLARRTFDLATGYRATMPVEKWLQRMLFLETVAGVPGMVAAMQRHLRSLRTMKRDHGWIHTLLEEAENERMHLLTFMQLREPGPLFRGMVLLAQGVFFNGYFLAYLVSPKTCHAFVGYLEEEAVKTYSHAIRELDAGRIPEWSGRPAPKIAVEYWQLPEDATMRDLLLAVRADEAAHKFVNHTFSDMKATDANPFSVGTAHVP